MISPLKTNSMNKVASSDKAYRSEGPVTQSEEKRENQREKVKAYYGETLQSSRDLKTGACCTDAAMPAYLRSVLAEVPGEILEKFYGCGSPIPEALEGRTVLDLGCGTGRDAYLLSKLVGPKGRVIGIDMTEAQIEVAERHRAGQLSLWGYPDEALQFKRGFIEDLAACGIANASVDVVVSNCVINLSPDKPMVFEEIFRVLKPGGEMLIADVFSDRRIPEWMRHDAELLGECLGGVLYIEDFRRLLRAQGCLDYRVVKQSPIDLRDEAILEKAGNLSFHSLTVRAFKLESLEDLCEDYGQVATYLGGIPHHPHRFELDDHHRFEAGKPMLVCGNTASMLAETRFAPHFKVDGNRDVHYGPFDCGEGLGGLSPKGSLTGKESGASGACC